MTLEIEGADWIVVRRAASDLSSALGVFDGLYELGHLEKLRSEERVGGTGEGCRPTSSTTTC